MEENVRDVGEFLWEFREEPGIFWGRKNKYLQGRSVEPLLELMDRHDVSCLMDSGSGWFLASNHTYRNPAINIEGDDVLLLEDHGDLFRKQNISSGINPYYSQFQEGREKSSPPRSLRRNPQFSKESVLQQALRYDIEQLEEGLIIADGGKERSTRSGRPDITARDRDGNLVAIELKKGTANSLTQLESYIQSMQETGETIRGILVAHDFHKHVEVAAESKPNISLKAYTICLTFEDC